MKLLNSEWPGSHAYSSQQEGSGEFCTVTACVAKREVCLKIGSEIDS